MARYTAYDPFAWIYNRHWSHFPAEVMPVLEGLALQHLAPGAHVLDLCCGTGQLAQVLIERGYRVTGVDGSEQMLAFARQNAPEAEFILADARAFRLPAPVDAIFCIYDSLNHLVSLPDLSVVFHNVNKALRPDGRFLFDLNMAEKYEATWTDSTGIVDDGHACIVRGSYEAESRIARFDATIFVRGAQWERSDFTIWERCYAEQEVTAALSDAGFVDISASTWRELDPAGEPGRKFFVCKKRRS